MDDRLRRKLASTPVPLELRLPDGRTERFGAGEPEFTILVPNESGLAALESLQELEVVEAYMRGDLDFEGDLMAAMDLRDLLSDAQLATRAWTFIQPALLGRKRLNPEWISKHYDSENMQLFAADTDWHVYTPGLYLSDDDTLEEGAERKLEYAFTSLELKPGDSVLDVGCGWGGFLRYCAQRGVDATGISLSRHQLDFAAERLAEDGLEATMLYQDFFDYEPSRRFDGISLMGSIEDLSDYDKVMQRLGTWLKPGGRIYLDFASVDRRFGVPSFVTKYVWPGAFRMVYMPSFMRALAKHHYDVVEMKNDRHNYHLWTLGGYERWMRRKPEVVAAAGEQTWRMMRLLMAGVAHMTSDRSTRATAYRVVLEPRGTKLPAPVAKEPRSLTGKVVVVTGGGRGIGAATARALAGAGAKVAIGDVDGEAATRAAEEIGGGALGLRLDVTDRPAFTAFLDEVEGRLGPLDVLINNAGIMPTGRFEDEGDDVVIRQLEINLHAVIHGTKEAARRMRPRGSGHIVNIASVAGLAGLPGVATYSATKFGVVGFSQAVFQELRGTGVDVSLVMPAYVNTELTAGVPDARGVKSVEPEEVANAIVDALRNQRYEVFVPKSIGGITKLAALLPLRAKLALAKALKTDRVVLEADPVARAAYLKRAAASAPAAEQVVEESAAEGAEPAEEPAAR